MMAHEIPLQAHPNSTTGTKTRKHKPVHQAKFSLPNGEKPDFGSGQKEKQKKGRAPQLPNGEKPDFGGSDNKGSQGSKTSATRKSKKSSGKKAEVSTPILVSAEAPKSAEVKDCYAGSSFHSSPEALALPKPSFAKKSPQVSNNLESLQGHNSPSGVAREVSNLPPAFVYQGMPSNGPPKYPVIAHPPSSASGFNYNANPQGFINYSYPPAAIPQPPLPMQSYPFQMYPPIPPPPSQRQVGGQKITFSDLMGSSY